MKRALTLAAVAVGLALALTSCGRHPLRDPSGGAGVPPASVTTPSGAATGDLSSVDSDLSTVDSQLAQSDQTSDADN